jgi:hypothetical protein
MMVDEQEQAQVAEYKVDYVKAMLKRECDPRKPNAKNLLARQRQTQPCFDLGDRDLLADFMIRLHERHGGFSSEVLFCAVDYLNRFLSLANVQNQEAYVAVVVTCLFIAFKYDVDVGVPVNFASVHQNLVSLAQSEAARHGRPWSPREVLSLEPRVLDTLDNWLGRPTSYDFFKLFLAESQAAVGPCCDEEKDQECCGAKLFGEYSLRVALCSSKFLDLRPSLVGVTCVALAMSCCCTNFKFYCPTYCFNKLQLMTLCFVLKQEIQNENLLGLAENQQSHPLPQDFIFPPRRRFIDLNQETVRELFLQCLHEVQIQ